ncbi:MAG: response regulator transcription factor [Anaerolineae bacterium]|nr:response regulator transcription factor [Anaerolineae bacterium]
MPQNILVVEDEPTLQETLIYNLEQAGYSAVGISDGLQGLEYARTNKPDLIVLDLMLPSLDGLEFTRILRREQNTPILILTAQAEEIDRVLGLEMGADDYLTKPFSMREFLARAKALLRRVRLDKEETTGSAAGEPASFQFGNLMIDTDKHEVRLESSKLQLKPKEYDLLLFLVGNQGKVLSRELILQRVWGWEFTGGSRTVDVHVRWLREKIEIDPTDPQRIVTVHGVGYRFDQ